MSTVQLVGIIGLSITAGIVAAWAHGALSARRARRRRVLLPDITLPPAQPLDEQSAIRRAVNQELFISSMKPKDKS
jgi:hypothetical protein